MNELYEKNNEPLVLQLAVDVNSTSQSSSTIWFNNTLSEYKYFKITELSNSGNINNSKIMAWDTKTETAITINLNEKYEIDNSEHNFSSVYLTANGSVNNSFGRCKGTISLYK